MNRRLMQEFCNSLSDLLSESARHQETKDALATANTEIANLHKRIRELEEVNRSLVDKANSYIVESGKLTNELVAERDALAKEQEVSDKLLAAFEYTRDAILEGRGPLEDVLDNDKTNAVLAVLDDEFGAALAEVAAIRTKDK